MKEFTNEDIKRVGLEILDAVHNFCVKNNLRYSLFYGTLLGAVRHKGFIPWDDDIDIVMPRKDYEIFIKNFGDENYGAISCLTNKDYFLPFGKAYDKRTLQVGDFFVNKGFEIGFNIDIFPLDEISSVEEFHKMKSKYKKIVTKHHFSLARKVKAKSLKDIGRNFLAGLYNGKSNTYSKIINEAVVKYFKDKPFNLYAQYDCFYPHMDYIFPKETFDNLIEMEFEGHKFLATAYYDECLKTSYGDYMTPPPENERATTHGFKAYFK